VVAFDGIADGLYNTAATCPGCPTIELCTHSIKNNEHPEWIGCPTSLDMSEQGRHSFRFSPRQWFATLERDLAWRLFSHLEPADLAQLGKATMALRCAVSAYSAAAWNLQGFLEPWKLNTRIFLAKAELTAAIITGWQALRFPERLAPDPQDGIHVMVRIGGFLTLGRHLLNEGYSIDYGESSGDPFERLLRLVIVAANDGRIERLASDYESILAVTFVKLSDEPLHRRRIMKVHMTVTNSDPIDFVIATSECSA
jgi:hypothetical protein